jgi:hypothetical protein
VAVGLVPKGSEGFTMMLSEWNALKTGNKVLVHEERAQHLSALTKGVVLSVTPAPRANNVGIRVTTDGEDVVLWPPHMTVHPDPINLSETCWRCDRFTGRDGVEPVEPVAPGADMIAPTDLKGESARLRPRFGTRRPVLPAAARR